MRFRKELNNEVDTQGNPFLIPGTQTNGGIVVW